MIRENRNRLIWLTISSLVVVYAGLFIAVSVGKYLNFLYCDWDLALYNQTLRGLLHGKPYISLIDVPFLGNHVEITLVGILPVYALFPHPVTLLIIQSLMLGLAAIPLFLITKHLLNDAWGVIFVIIYLIYPAVGYINLNEFHPESFLPFIQFFLLYFFIKNDFRKFAIFLFLCLFAKENMSLVIIMLGFYALIRRKEKKWVILPITSGVLWFLFYLKVLSPALSGGKINFYDFYGHLGGNLGQIISTIILHPVQVMKFMFLPHKLYYLMVLFGPLSFLSLLSPSILLIALPNFLQHFISSRITEVSLSFYYPSEMLAFIFISAIFGLSSLLKFSWVRERRVWCYIIVSVVAVTFSVRLSPQLLLFNELRSICTITDDARIKDDFIRQIPQGAAVISTFQLMPKLSDRTDRLYSFHRVLEGRYHSKKDFVLPSDIEFALVDFNDPLTFTSFFSSQVNKRNILSFVKENQWGPLGAEGNLVFFKKNSPKNLSICDTGFFTESGNPIHATFDNGIELISYILDEEALQNSRRLKISFFWRALKKIDDDYWLFVAISDKEGHSLYSTVHPLCYRVYPPNAWKNGETVKEDYWLTMPRYFDKGSYRLYVGLFDAVKNKVSSARIGAQVLNDRGIHLTDFQLVM